MKIDLTAFTLWNAALAVVCGAQLPMSLATEGTCSPGDSVCIAQSKEEWKACGVKFRPTNATTLPSPPDVWQRSLCWNNPDASAYHDVIIFGAGIGGAYIANRLRIDHSINPSIALMEAGQNVGGRLMSSFHSGAHGMVVRPFNAVNNVAPPEYGGMRIEPKYTLVWEQVVNLWNREFKDNEGMPKDAQCSKEFCESLENANKCCYGLLTPMNVGNAFYHNSNPRLGKMLMHSSLIDKNALYTKDGPMYDASKIANYDTYSPFVQCLLLAVGTKAYVNDHKDVGNLNAKDGFSKACSKPACDAIDGFCGLCDQFNGNEAKAVTSCSGYDLNIEDYNTNFVIELAAEVLNIEGTTFLYLFTVGYQRLAMSILSGFEVDHDGNRYKQVAVAPHFNKKLVAIGVGPGDFDNAVERAKELSRRQVLQFLGKPVQPYDGPLEPIQYQFEDGSMSNSHLGYLTMLPRDFEEIRGLEPWSEQINDNTTPNLAFKAVIAWEEFSLAEELGLTPCVNISNYASEPGFCDRIILDGEQETQLVRQAWPWDYKSILLYAAGGAGSPAQHDIETATHEGLEVLLKRAINELRVAVKGITSQTTGKEIVIPDPAYFRGKMWPLGSLLVDWPIHKDTKGFVEHIRRPLGDEINVWYGNSEISLNGDNHGWAEGALECVNASLPEIVPTLHKYVKN